ncbi:outer membrane protein [Helicobacter baculiformis]|uniref:Outer membrane protein n=1 Tax=Helicobacter baculiformis TaxID=427351 RepID=A0ABV7ZIU7_9HELI|nr:outer membrane protein [Helicobacter baculiformis]
MSLKRSLAVAGLVGVLGLGVAPLHAERDGAYISGGVQYAYFTTKWGGNGNIGGIDIRGGYQQFFNKRKNLGARYYGNFSVSGGSGLSNISYGVGADVLYDFYGTKKYVIGTYGGLMLLGSSWIFQRGSVSNFQLPLNVGIRANFLYHHGVELGMLIPIVPAYNGFRRAVAIYANYVWRF